MDLFSLSKSSLSVIAKKVGIRGDYARMPKAAMAAKIGLLAGQSPAIAADVAALLATLPPSSRPLPVVAPLTAAAAAAAAAAIELLPAKVEPVAPTLTQGEPVRCVGQRPVADLFGVDLIDRAGAPVMVDVWNDPLAPTGQLLADYVFDRETLRICLSAVRNGWNFWMGGPASTGKTEFAIQFAARTGRALFRVSFDGTMERAELFGDVGLRDGCTLFEPGIVLQGMQRPGAVVLLDEISNMRPDFAASLHPVLEPGGSYRVTRTGQVFRPAPGVVWFAADNSMGGGDYSGQYAGLKPLNGATRSRFIKCAFSYLPESAEAKLIAGRLGVGIEFAKQLVSFVAKCRVASSVGEIEMPPTLRQVLPMAGMIRDGVDPRAALAACVLADQSPAGAEKVQQIWAANVNEGNLLAALAPSTMQAAMGKAKAAKAEVATASSAQQLREALAKL